MNNTILMTARIDGRTYTVVEIVETHDVPANYLTGPAVPMVQLVAIAEDEFGRRYQLDGSMKADASMGDIEWTIHPWYYE